MLLLSEYPKNIWVLDNSRLNPQFHADMKFSSNVFGKRLVLAADKLFVDAQMCTVANRFIHNLDLMCYIWDRVVKEAGICLTLINLYEMPMIGLVNNTFAVALTTSGFGPV